MGAALKQSDNRARGNLRLNPDSWKAIDEAGKQRAGFVSRNTRAPEAVVEKLAKERQDA
jgi:hypothetical protein